MQNELFYGDNLVALRNYIKDETIDLCYIDPPFNSKRNYHQIYNNIGNEEQTQTQAFTDTWIWDEHANAGFLEILANDMGRFSTQTVDLLKGLQSVLKKGSLLAYLVSIALRVTEIHRALKPTGSFYLHCDPTASHYLKLVVDAIFVPDGGTFLNEIIWGYSIGGKSKHAFGRKHDVILFYAKSAGKHTFNKKGASIQRKPDTHMKSGIDAEGRPYQEKTNRKTGKTYRYYLDEGKIAEDYWTDIETLNREDKERLGYPTQKPEALLERIIKTSSNEDDLILDAYCGCGTTIAVAERLKRRWIGMDITYQSISLILRRLEGTLGKESLDNITLKGIPKDIDSAHALALKEDDRVCKEFEKWAVLTYTHNRAIINDKKSGDKGIDGTMFFLPWKDVHAKIVFQVKSGTVGRGDVSRFNNHRIREGAELGIFLTLQLPTQCMKSEASAAGIYEHPLLGCSYPCIQIVTIAEIVEQHKRLDVPMNLEGLQKAQTMTLNILPQELFIDQPLHR